MRRRKYEENKGLTGMGRDYSVYHMGTAEKLKEILEESGLK